METSEYELKYLELVERLIDYKIDEATFLKRVLGDLCGGKFDFTQLVPYMLKFQDDRGGLPYYGYINSVEVRDHFLKFDLCDEIGDEICNVQTEDFEAGELKSLANYIYEHITYNK